MVRPQHKILNAGIGWSKKGTLKGNRDAMEDVDLDMPRMLRKIVWKGRPGLDGWVAPIFALVLVWCAAGLAAPAQATAGGEAVVAPGIAGNWQGTLEVEKHSRIVLKVSREGDAQHATWRGVMYNLDGDMAYEGYNTTTLSLEAGVVRFAIVPIETRYEGKLSADGASMVGMFTEGGGKPHALTLARAEGDAAWAIPKADAAMAKDADPDWEVATVRPSDPEDTHAGFHLRGRRIFIERQTVESMLLLGYGVHRKQIAGAPDWIATEHWDVNGVPDVPGQPGLKQIQSMVRKILVERFGLASHMETRDLAIYAITVAKGGPKMEKSAGDPNGLLDEDENENGGQRNLQMTNATIGDLALVMKFMMDRPVVDQTQLPGRYDFRLKWTFDETRAPTDGSAAPSVFTAIEEQMGLKLDAVKAPAEVMVIDKVERPSAN
jgi:uncharacterized protein (TIGR03435 family)